MPADIRVFADIQPPIEDIIGRLGLTEMQIEMISARAINATLPQVRARMAQDLEDEVNVQIRFISRQIGLTRASAEADPHGQVRLKRKPIPISAFLGGEQEEGGYQVEVLKDEGERLLPRAFEAMMPSGHMLVGQRKRQGGDDGLPPDLAPGEQLVGRLPIRQRYGPSLTTVLLGIGGGEDLLKTEVQSAGEILQANVIDALVNSGMADHLGIDFDRPYPDFSDLGIGAPL